MSEQWQLGRVSLVDMTHASAKLRKLGDGAASMEEAAQRIVRFLFESFADANGARSCGLVRMYKTHPFGALPAELQQFAQGAAPEAALSAQSRCLTLLASAGVEPAWNGRRGSTGHRAIPLTSVEAIQRLPMVMQLLVQLGVDVARIVSADPQLIVDQAQRSFNVFHVETARRSPFIPAQDGFVVPYGIVSVLGFGGALPSGELFSLIIFSRAHITRATAELFKPLALAIKLALLPFDGRVFDS
jgi:hypothetical protein